MKKESLNVIFQRDYSANWNAKTWNLNRIGQRNGKHVLFGLIKSFASKHRFFTQKPKLLVKEKKSIDRSQKSRLMTQTINITQRNPLQYFFTKITNSMWRNPLHNFQMKIRNGTVGVRIEARLKPNQNCLHSPNQSCINVRVPTY